MIELCNLTKEFVLHGQRKTVCRDLSLVLPPRRSIALLGRNGAGKSTLLNIIAGVMAPTRGEVRTTGRVSWPVGFAGSFHGDLTGAQNARFVARIYGADTAAVLDFVEEFANLGPHFRLPFRTYSAGMKSRLAFGVSMAIPFDTYLVDEVTSVGDAAFRQRSGDVFKARMQQAGAVVVSHAMGVVRDLCDVGLVLENGAAHYYEDLDAAIAHHQHNMARPAA